ncbi:MAG: hypothetical protein A2Y10_17385 [Planctomycetes bacterium GWF2_41_51]|nr:MAG: hypothetical protein A2Y10_17385 [Planctomycetes bacterium GWF2_41_51]HBG28000.1 hypothetical protein [Phycisphaerales bacterium]
MYVTIVKKFETFYRDILILKFETMHVRSNMKNSFDNFKIGCNYLSSNAGCFMWQRWDESVVRKDLELLNDNNIKLLRVFPIWSDFQPLKIIYSEYGKYKTVCSGAKEAILSQENNSGIDPIMFDRFQTLCGIAEEYGMQLTVMLLTGWISGRQFKPPALEHLNIYSDPFALRWTTKYIKTFVSCFKEKKNIIAWGLGNESNVMNSCLNSHTAYVWTELVSNAIRMIDSGRPIISSMHGLTVNDEQGPWTISDQAQCCDILTVHPYPLFTPCFESDPINGTRNSLHSAAESCLYSDIGSKPCLVEEIGDLGRSICSESAGGDYLSSSLWTSWSHGCLGFLWWCAFDFSKIEGMPYEEFSFEGQLGLFRNGVAKASAGRLQDFQRLINTLPQYIKILPKRKIDAVCIVPNGQNVWAASLSSFILSKQAGFDLQFAGLETELPDCELYLMPSMCGLNAVKRNRWDKLLARVQNGATLYLSCVDALLPDFSEVAGIKIECRRAQLHNIKCRFSGSEFILPIDPGHKNFIFDLVATHSEILAETEKGVPLLTCSKYGNGKVYFLNYGLELNLANLPGAFDSEIDYSQFYKTAALEVIAKRLVRSEKKHALALTEHDLKNGKFACIGVNISGKELETSLLLNSSVQVKRIIYGSVKLQDNSFTVHLKAGEGFILELRKV